MATLKFKIDQLQDFFSGTYHHKAYEITSKLANDVRVHADGIYPKDIIECRRPSESEAVKEYRESIWEPITKPEIGKVINVLNKIRRSSEWSIKFDNSFLPKSIREGERLEDYLNYGMKEVTSITNWSFNVLLKSYLVDANALVVVLPFKDELTKEIDPNEYLQPYPIIYNSDQIIEYVPEDYAVLLSTDKCIYREKDIEYFGDVYYVITTEYIQRWEQRSRERAMQMTFNYNHGLGLLPVIKTKGLFRESLEGIYIYESRLSPMLPKLNEALREYSDLQAEVVQHIYSEKWEYVTDECPDCKGKGFVRGVGFSHDSHVKCNTCKGSGAKPRGPYAVHQVKAGMAGENNGIPTPPMGYVQKSTDIVKIQDERIDKHLFKALASINMQFLMNTPLNQSGYAKEVDKEELNNFVNSIAEDLVAIIDNVVLFINEYRYKLLVTNPVERRKMLPIINVPEVFDVLSVQTLEKHLVSIKNTNISPIIINALEIDYANKKFNSDPAVRDRLILQIELDPLSGVNDDDKMVRLSNGGITKETYVISSNIRDFIDRALEEHGDKFLNMKTKERKEIIKAYATEQINLSSVSRDIISDITEA